MSESAASSHEAVAIILAGGQGMRMRGGLAHEPSKVLTQIEGQSLLAWSVLIARQIADSVMVLGDHDWRAVEGESRSLGVDFEVVQASAPGTKVLHAASRLSNRDLVVLSGDTLCRPESHMRVRSAHAPGSSTVGLAIQPETSDSQWRLANDGEHLERTTARTNLERACWFVSSDRLVNRGLGHPDDEHVTTDEPSGFEHGSINALIERLRLAGTPTNFLVDRSGVVNVNRRSDIARAERFVRDHLLER
jgi:GTP:adenosylcobinamide-phosphate guanylyltransferase